MWISFWLMVWRPLLMGARCSHKISMFAATLASKIYCACRKRFPASIPFTVYPRKRSPLMKIRRLFRLIKNIYLDTDCGQLDCLGNIDGIGNYSDVKKHSHYISLAGKSFPILTLPALIRSKEAMGRPRDKENTLLLKAIQEKQNLDKPEI